MRGPRRLIALGVGHVRGGRARREHGEERDRESRIDPPVWIPPRVAVARPRAAQRHRSPIRARKYSATPPKNAALCSQPAFPWNSGMRLDAPTYSVTPPESA